MKSRGRGLFLRRGVWAAVVMAVVAGAGVAVGTMQASAATVDVKAWYVLVNRDSGKVLDGHSFAKHDGAAVVQWGRHGGANQQWRFIDAGDGHYRVQNRNSGKVLDDYNWSKTAGTGIVQWSDLNGVNQQFRVAQSPDGYVRLINRFSGMAVEVRDAAKADGGKVVQSRASGGANQQWRLIPTDGAGAPAATGGSAATSPAAGGTRPPASSPAAGGAMAAVAAMQPGWNLGNALDAVGSDETAWGNPRITKTLLDTVRAQGFNSIRIPVTWDSHQSATAPYTVDAAYLGRVKEVVDWALADGFYVMINIHHDSWRWVEEMPRERAKVLNRYNALWTQIAEALRNESPKLTFESVNEPLFNDASNAQSTQSAQLLNELNTSFHRIVRKSGGNNATRLLVLPTLNTSADRGPVGDLAATFKQLNDPNLIATVHFYGYWPFSANHYGTTQFDAQSVQNIQGSFDHVYDAFVAKGIPVIIGEYGLLRMDYTAYPHSQGGPSQVETLRGETLKYLEYLGYYARTRKITTMLWDNGEHFNRKTLKWRDSQLIDLIKSSDTTRSGTASSDLLFVPRSGSITSTTLTLNPNGTTFQGLRLGDADLARGADYTVSGNQLTLTASALTRMLGSREYGLNATLMVRFSDGTPWRISVITNDTPILSDASGSTSSFAIPTRFRSDQLAKMEAKYADGSNAGPENWTPFKAFDSSFVPGPNAISVKPDFFAEIKDGARVTLTFHFWSGATVTYFVTKSGNRVTGTTS